jgi:peptidoglycan/LPS O-acetylase OafA/YrhL
MVDTPSSAYDAFAGRRVFSSLDGLRCLSIATVVWHHSQVPALVYRLWPSSRFGFLGVDLFFMISGFLIVTLALRERERRGRISLRGFYARRALRILPVYYGLLVAFAFLFLVVRPGTPNANAFVADLPILLLYLSNWVPVHGWFEITWSLAVEEQFYLVWPPIEKWLRRWAVPILVVVICASLMVQLGMLDAWIERTFAVGPDEPCMMRDVTFAPICYGVLLAHLLHRRRSHARVSWLVGGRLMAPLLLALLVAYCALLPDQIRGFPRIGVHVLLLLLLASCVIREDNGLSPLLRWRPVARIGVLSYGIYLYHQICLAIAHKGLAVVDAAHPVAVLVLACVLVWIVAELSYRHFEARFLRLKERFA